MSIAALPFSHVKKEVTNDMLAVYAYLQVVFLNYCMFVLCTSGVGL